MDAYTVLALLVAALCFVLATLAVPGRVAWLPLGLLAWVTVPPVHAIDAL